MSVLELVVGRIVKPHGVRGELVLDVRTDEPERRIVVGADLRAEPPRGSAWRAERVRVTGVRRHQGMLLVTLDGVADRDTAESARGLLLHAEVDAGESPADPEEFYDHQLVGLTAHDTEGARLGEVVRVVHGAAQDLLTIRTPDGRDALVPFVAALVPEVDPAAGRLVIADRPGLVSPFPDEGGA